MDTCYRYYHANLFEIRMLYPNIIIDTLLAGKDVVGFSVGIILFSFYSWKSKKLIASEDKFACKDGITLYYFPRSPCARRVLVALRERNVIFNEVQIDLLNGDQRNPSFLEINPQGKVPAIRIHNHEKLKDCCLYESYAILEWIDEEFPLYYEDMNHSQFSLSLDELRWQMKIWQYWELCVAELVWPLSRQQVDAVLWRVFYSRHSFCTVGPAGIKEENLNIFHYRNKVLKLYDGKFLSSHDARCRIFGILKAFQMLEFALEKRPFNSYLISDQISFVDISIYTRLNKAPQNGILCSSSQRNQFPRVVQYFRNIRNSSLFAEFKESDEKMWDSGQYPKFIPQWWGNYISWSWIVALGNIRAKTPSFRRITQNCIPKSDIQKVLNEVNHVPLRAIPDSIDISPNASNITFSSVIIPKRQYILYYNSTLPLSISVQLCVKILNITCIDFIRINILKAENFSDDYLRIMPFGEVPALLCRSTDPNQISDVIYGPNLIVEYLLEHEESVAAATSLPRHTFTAMLPPHALDKARVRKWFGWSRTAWNYQLQPLYHHLIASPVLKQTNPDMAALRATFASNCSESSLDHETDLNALMEAYANPWSLQDEDCQALIQELITRLDTVDAELAEQSFHTPEVGEIYLASKRNPTYADYFVLPVVLLAERWEEMLLVGSTLRENSRSSKVSRPWLTIWKKNLLRDPSVSQLCSEMLLTYNTGNMKQLFPAPRAYNHEVVCGVPYPPFIRQETVTTLRKHFRSEPGDIFICTYPKCGTTWMQQIVLLLIYDGDGSRVLPHPALQHQAPWLEGSFCRPERFAGPRPYTDTLILEQSPAVRHVDVTGAERRVFKTHAPFQLFPCAEANMHPATKVIYVARNPKDTACSLFAHSTAIPLLAYQGEWNHFFREMFMTGRVESGSWFEHNANWFQAVRSSSIGANHQILWVFFEDLKLQPEIEIARVASFLGIPMTPELLQKVIKESSFETMRARAEAAHSTLEEANSRFRQGTIGKWHVDNGGRLDEAQSRSIDESYAASMPEELSFKY